nr:16S rRNA (guanine(527)-N(7))-methyltransferase RsmG [Tsuneonella aeria]
MSRLDRFVAELRGENERQNLVAASSLNDVWRRHVADSAQLLEHVTGYPGTWLDLGTGAGFPGLVVAIMRPEWRVSMVEVRRKRVDWLSHIVEVLKLSHVKVHFGNIERIENCDASVISARAFAPLPKLIDLAARFSTDRTQWLLPKGRSAAQEVRDLPGNIRVMFHVERSLTDPEAGIVVGTGRISNNRKGAR